MKLPTFLLTVALSSLALAGCIESPQTDAAVLDGASATDLSALTVVHSATGAALPADAAALVASAKSRLLSIGADAVEPTLGVTSDGSIFYAAASFSNPNAQDAAPVTSVLRSQDGGKSWEDVSPRVPVLGLNNPPVTFDPYVWVDPDTDRVFNVELEALLCSVLSYSDDLGATWTTSPVGCGLPPGVHDHQTLVTGKPTVLATVGYPNVVYYCVNRIVDSACATSIDGGLTFGPLVTVYPGAEECDGFIAGGLHAHVVAGPDGTVFLGKAQCNVPEVAISRDNGLTWTRTVINGEVGALIHEVTIAVDVDNNVYAFWIDNDGKARLAASTDGGATFGEALDVTHPAVTATHLPAIAAGDAGQVALAYVGTEHPGGYAENEGADAWKNATWNGYLAIVPNALAADPLVVTTLANDPADPLVRGVCGPGRCPGMYDFIDLVLDNEGRPWAAFVDACTEKCATPEGTTDDPKSFLGLVATLETGPALRGGGALPALL